MPVYSVRGISFDSLAALSFALSLVCQNQLIQSCYYDPTQVSFPLSENKQESSWLLLLLSQWGLQTACAWHFGDEELETHF